MKSIITSLLLFVGFLCSYAQSPKEVITSMKSHLNALGCVYVTFSFEAKNASGELIASEKGSFTAEGEMFCMKITSAEIFCDGSSKWIYDKNNEEVTIFPHDASIIDFLENPFSALRKMDISKYNLQMKTMGTVVMKPQDKDADYNKLVIDVNMTTSLPASISFENKSGDVYRALLSSIKSVPSSGAESFVPSEKILKSALVTDMR